MAPIYVRITVDGKRAECSTSKTIKPEYWNSDKGLTDANYYLAKPISEYLRQTEVEINRHFNILLSMSEYVSAEDVKRSYKGTKETHKSLLELFTQYIKKLEERRDKNDLSAGHNNTDQYNAEWQITMMGFSVVDQFPYAVDKLE